MAEEVDWGEYFASIKGVCPWSWAAYKHHQIRIQGWHSQILDLGTDLAIVYIAPNHTPRLLKKLVKALNQQYPKYEFLWSHPRYKYHSTPKPVIIQQCRATLEKHRKNINYTP